MDVMNINWKDAWIVVAAGSIGGLVSFIYSTISGEPPALDAFPYGLLFYTALGGTAGFLGVHFLARTDTRHGLHCLALALVCGLFWNPVLEGASTVMQVHKERRTERAVLMHLGKAESALGKLGDVDDPQALPAATQGVVDANRDLAQLASTIKDRHLANRVEAQLDASVRAIAATREKQPDLASRAIDNIRKVQLAAGFSSEISVVTVSKPLTGSRFLGEFVPGDGESYMLLKKSDEDGTFGMWEPEPKKKTERQ